MAALGRTASIAQELLIPRVIEELEELADFDPKFPGPEGDRANDTLNKVAKELKSSDIPLSPIAQSVVTAAIQRSKGNVTTHMDAVKDNIAKLLAELKKMQGGRRRRPSKKTRKSRKAKRSMRTRKMRRGGDLRGTLSAAAAKAKAFGTAGVGKAKAFGEKGVAAIKRPFQPETEEEAKKDYFTATGDYDTDMGVKQ